ncbi:MAG: amidase [Alphaproteobacteria bacterium]|nr:amidase [Alphaproteobacteria bacterium]
MSLDDAVCGAHELASALAARKVGAVELFDAAVARIEAGDGAINAVVVRDFDRAREAAKAADAALARGERAPLLGVPMTVKEAFDIEGLPTTWGLAPFRDHRPSADATVVARLKAAGAVILGKTNVPPYLSDWQSANPIYGRTNNPRDLTRSPGGSSGGSAAALAAGLVSLEYGSDIGGSIRVPSAFCGVVGHKPSYELVPQTGHKPPGVEGGLPPPIGVVGPLARTITDLELALDVTAGPDGEAAAGYRLQLPAPRMTSAQGLRVLVLTRHPLAPADHEIVEAVEAAAAALEAGGAKILRQSDRLPDLVLAHRTYLRVLMTVMSRGAPPTADTPNAHAYLEGLDIQADLRRQWRALFEEVDVILAPVLGTVAFPHMDGAGDWSGRVLTINGREEPFGDQLAWVGMASFGCLPATALPVGKTKAGLPIGAQIIGPYLGDRTCLAVARLIEGPA